MPILCPCSCHRLKNTFLLSRQLHFNTLPYAFVLCHVSVSARYIRPSPPQKGEFLRTGCWCQPKASFCTSWVYARMYFIEGRETAQQFRAHVLFQHSLGQLTTVLSLPLETSHPPVDSISTALIYTYSYSLSLPFSKKNCNNVFGKEKTLISGALENRANDHLEDSPTPEDMARTLSRSGCTSWKTGFERVVSTPWL